MTLWLSAGVRDAIAAEAAEIYPLETGGILLGWRSGEDRVVVEYRGAGDRALHGRYNFFPDHDWQLTEIRFAFEKSRGDVDYLGDWHTHPLGVPMMSNLDRSTLQGITRRVPEPIVVIFAGGPKEWLIGSWMGRRERRFLRSDFRTIDQAVRIFRSSAVCDR